jgi:hypothetical protein
MKRTTMRLPRKRWEPKSLLKKPGPTNETIMDLSVSLIVAGQPQGHRQAEKAQRNLLRGCGEVRPNHHRRGGDNRQEPSQFETNLRFPDTF